RHGQSRTQGVRSLVGVLADRVGRDIPPHGAEFLSLRHSRTPLTTPKEEMMFAPQPESPPTSKEGRRRASADALRRCCLLAWAFLFAVANAGTVSAGGKVDICHFQPDEGTWKRLSVGGNASASHLEKH